MDRWSVKTCGLLYDFGCMVTISVNIEYYQVNKGIIMNTQKANKNE